MFIYVSILMQITVANRNILLKLMNCSLFDTKMILVLPKQLTSLRLCIDELSSALLTLVLLLRFLPDIFFYFNVKVVFLNLLMYHI